jgi:hypothetical protein
MYELDLDFFLNKGRSRRTEKLQIIGGATSYIRGQQEKINYRLVHTFCIKDTRYNLRNAIGSSFFSTEMKQRSTVNYLIAGDETTWDG